MPLHYALAYAATFVIPLVVGAAAYRTSRRSQATLWASLTLACAGVVVSLIVTAAGGVLCSDSYAVRLHAAKHLSRGELTTMRGGEFLCPRVYYFERGGETTCLRPNGDGGASIGCG